MADVLNISLGNGAGFAFRLRDASDEAYRVVGDLLRRYWWDYLPGTPSPDIIARASTLALQCCEVRLKGGAQQLGEDSDTERMKIAHVFLALWESHPLEYLTLSQSYDKWLDSFKGAS